MTDDELLKQQAKENGWVLVPKTVTEEDGEVVANDDLSSPSALFSPITTQKKSERVSIRMSLVEKEWIEKVADKKQSSASEIIRDALRMYQQYVEGEDDV